MTPTQPKLLIVEDEAIFASDLADRLVGMGYSVIGIAATAARAMEMAVACAPDLVLMDVRIRGGVDGVELAGLMATSLDLPVVFLTAYADEATIARAGETQPYGYLLKPVNERELRATVSTALTRHASELRRLRADRGQAALLGSMRQAVLAVTGDGTVAFLNPSAVDLLGCGEDAQGRAVGELVRLLGDDGLGIELPAAGLRREAWLLLGDARRRRVRVQVDAVTRVFPSDPDQLVLLTPIDG